MRRVLDTSLALLLLLGSLGGCARRVPATDLEDKAPAPRWAAGIKAKAPASKGTTDLDARAPDLSEKGLKASNLTSRDVDPLYAPMRYAIVVGVNQPNEPSLNPLRFAESDAGALSDTLKSPTVGGFDRVVTLLHPTRTELYGALEEAERLLRPQDLFLLYFSGHGTASIDAGLHTSLFLMTRDTSLTRLDSTGVSVRDVQGRLERMRPRRKVLIVDACYNGDGKSGLSASTRARTRQMKGIGGGDLKEPPRESEAHLFAAAVGQPALEDATLKSGVYTHYLLAALRRTDLADANGDAAVSVAEAHSYARDQTMARTGYRQVPWANYRIVGREDIYLAGRQRLGAEQALVYTFSEKYGGARVFLNGQEKGILPRAMTVDPGTYQLTLKAPDGSVFFDRAVHLDSSTTVQIDDLDLAVSLSRQSARRVQWTGLGVTAGLGLAATITGFQTLQYKTYYDTGSFTTQEEANQVRAQGERFRLATNLLIGGAAATGVTTGILYFRAPKLVLRRFGIVDTKVGTAVGPDGGAVAVSGGF